MDDLILAQILATLWAFMLPSVRKSIYFNQENNLLAIKKSEKFQLAFRLLWKHFKTSYSNMSVIKWSLWWAMATCGFIQVQYYMQTLWSEIEPGRKSIYNGAVEAVLTLLGTLAALLAGTMKTNWKLKGELLLTICSIVQGSSLLISSYTQYIWISYVCYIVFGSLYHFIITIVSSEVAKDIPEDSYGLVFGLNTLIALSLQTILMLIVVDGNIGFGLSPRKQYNVYGGYFMGIATVYIIFGFIQWSRTRNAEQLA